MNYTKYILVLVLSFFLITNTNAQKNKSKPINTGFVFIDGKYIEPPYVVKKKGLSVYINNKKIINYNQNEERNPFTKFKNRLPTPPCITKTSTLEDFNNCREPANNSTYYDYMLMYYMKNYIYEDAKDSIINYIKLYPNVEQVNFTGSIANISFYNGENLALLIGYSSVAKMSKKWGPGGQKNNIDKKIQEDLVKDKQKSVIGNLKRNTALLYTSNNKNKKQTIIYKEDILKFDRILNSTYTIKQKHDSLKNIIRNKKALNIILNNYQISDNYKLRIKKMQKEIEINFDLNENVKKSLNNSNNLNLAKNVNTTGSTSPSSDIVKIWCPYNEWDEAFEHFDDECKVVTDGVRYQGYNNVQVFMDNIANDVEFDVEDCSYENLINISNAGIVYLGCHGTENGEIVVQMSNDPNDLYDWCDYADYVTVAQIPLK